MPLTQLSQLASTVSSINPLFAPIGIIAGIIAKMSVKIPFLRRLFRKSKINFVFMPDYKHFISTVSNEKIKEKYLFIDFDDYVKTILNEQELTEFNKFVERGDNDLYKQIVSDMVNKIFNSDINTNKKIIYFIDNEKIFKLINKKRKIYVYPRSVDDGNAKAMYLSIVENAKKKMILYKSFSDLEEQIAVSV